MWPSLNAPHSGWPNAPQPALSALTLSRSDHPSDFCGQPSASAIGFQSAITTGERTTGSPGGQIGAVCPATPSQFWLSSATYAPEAGLKTAGCRSPESTACIASPEPIARRSRRMGLPLFVFGLPPANVFASCSSQAFFSLP